MVLRVAKICAVATKHANEDWNQQMTRRDKLQTAQINEEERTRVPAAPDDSSSNPKNPFQVSRGSVNNELESMFRRQTARATAQKMSKHVPGTAELCRDFSGDINTEVLSSLLQIEPGGGCGLGSTSPEGEATPVVHGTSLEQDMPLSPHIEPSSRTVEM